MTPTLARRLAHAGPYVVLMSLLAAGIALVLPRLIDPYDALTHFAMNFAGEAYFDPDKRFLADVDGAPLRPSTSLRDDVVVVLFTDEDLRRLQIRFPVPLDVQARLIETLAQYKPRSILLDFLFADPYTAEAPMMVAALQAAKDLAPDLRVYLPEVEASTSTAAGAAASAAPAEALARRLLAVENVTGVAVPELDPHGVAGQLRYPVWVGDGKERLASPAFAMAADAGVFGAAGLAALGRRDVLEVLWKRAPPEAMGSYTGCERKRDGVIEGLREGSLYPKGACPWQRTIKPWHLLGVDQSFAPPPAMLEGRHVVVGASFEAAGDLVKTPVGDRTPGAYVHAMALHNLLYLKGGFKRASSAWGDVLLVLTAVIAVLIALLLRWLQPAAPEVGRVIELFFKPDASKGWARLGMALYRVVLLACVALFVLAWWVDSRTLMGLGILGVVLVWNVRPKVFWWIGVATLVLVPVAFFGFDIGGQSAVVLFAMLLLVHKLDGALVTFAREYRQACADHLPSERPRTWLDPIADRVAWCVERADLARVFDRPRSRSGAAGSGAGPGVSVSSSMGGS